MFFKIPSMVAGAIIVTITILVSGYSIFNAFKINVKESDVIIPGLNKEIRVV